MERKINERILNIKGVEIKLGEVNEKQNEMCDIIEEICMVDNRAARMIIFIINKLGKVMLDNSCMLKEFTESHMPGKANYELLSKIIKDIDLTSDSDATKRVVENISNGESKFSAANTRRKDINIPNNIKITQPQSSYVDRSNTILIKKIAYDLAQEFKVIRTEYESVIKIVNILNNVSKDNPIEKPKTICINSTDICINDIPSIVFQCKVVYTMSYDTLKVIIREFQNIYNTLAEQELFEHLTGFLTEDDLWENELRYKLDLAPRSYGYSFSNNPTPYGANCYQFPNTCTGLINNQCMMCPMKLSCINNPINR